MRQIGWKGFQRTGTVFVIVLAVLIVGVVSGPRAEGQGAFGAGSGRAEAKFLKVGPSRGALTLAPQVGLALSDFLNTRGRGDVRTVDFAALEDSVPVEVRDALPTVKVESTEEGSEDGKTTAVGSPPEVPVQVDAAELHADAGPAPHGASSFKAGSVDIGIGTIVGGRAEARSGVVKGNVREAIARVVIPRIVLADGAVVLQNLEWMVVNRSGAATTEEATFTLGAVSIAGQAFQPPAGSEQPLKDVAAALVPVLKPLGLEITFPTTRIENGVVELSPLRFRVANSELFGPPTNTVLGAVQPGREALVAGIRGGSEDVDAAILLSDVAVGVLAGGSTLDLEIGGTRAFTAEPAAGFSFGSFDLASPPAPPLGTDNPLTGGSDLADPGPIASVGATGDAPAPDEGAAAGSELVALPTSSPASRGGPLLLVGLLGCALATATAVADYRKIKTGTRLIPAR